MSTCRHTGPEVLAVRTVHGFDIKLDPQQLDPLGELRAQVAGRATYTVYGMSGEVHPRTARKIRCSPAGSVPRAYVHALHDCTPTGRETMST